MAPSLTQTYESSGDFRFVGHSENIVGPQLSPAKRVTGN